METGQRVRRGVCRNRSTWMRCRGIFQAHVTSHMRSICRCASKNPISCGTRLPHCRTDCTENTPARGRAVRSSARRWHMQWWPPWPEEACSVHLKWHACIRLCAGMQPAARAEGANAGSSECIDVADRSLAWLQLHGRVYMVTLGMRDHGCRPCAVCVGGERPQRRACGWGAQRNASAQGFSLSHRKTRSGVEWRPLHQVAHDMRATKGYSEQLRATQGYSGLLRAANTNKLGNRKVKLSKPYNFPLGACGGSHQVNTYG
jgi:hypothetical protein